MFEHCKSEKFQKLGHTPACHIKTAARKEPYWQAVKQGRKPC